MKTITNKAGRMGSLAFFGLIALVRVVWFEVVLLPDETPTLLGQSQVFMVNVCGNPPKQSPDFEFAQAQVVVWLNCTSACLKSAQEPSLTRCVQHLHPPTPSNVKSVARELKIEKESALVLFSWEQLQLSTLGFGLNSLSKGLLTIDPINGAFRVALDNSTNGTIFRVLKTQLPSDSQVGSDSIRSPSRESRSGEIDKWFQSIPLLFERRKLRDEPYKLPFERKQRHRPIVLLVITSEQQIEMLNTIYSQPFDGFFSPANSCTLVIASSQLWRSGGLDRLKLLQASNTWTVPPERVLGDSPALLELQGLSYSLLLKDHFSNVIVFPFNRLPLRLWSEIGVVSFGTEKIQEMATHWHNNTFVNDLESDQGKDAGHKAGVFSILRLRDRFSPGSIRGFLFCDSRSEIIGIRYKHQCYMDAAKSISLEALEDLFVQRTQETARVIKSIFTSDSHERAYSARTGSFFSSLFPQKEWSSWVHLAPMEPIAGILDEQLTSTDWMFSSVLTATGFSVPSSVTRQFLEEMNKIRETPALKLGFPKACITSRFQGSGNLGLHPATPFNYLMLQEGEEELLKAKEMAWYSIRLNSTTPQDRRIVFVAIIHKTEHIEMLSKIFVEMEDREDMGLDVVIVPEKNMFSESDTAQQLLEFNRHKRVHVIPEQLALIGVWGGATLVLKELIGYIYAVSLFPNLSHAVLVSADSILLRRKAELHQLLEPGKTYIQYARFHSWSDALVGRNGRRYPQCGDAHRRVVQFSETPLPDDVGLYLRKHSQWKVVSGKHIREVFLAQNGRIAQVVNSFQNHFKFGRIPDEHWVGSVFHYLYQTGLIDGVEDRLVVHEVWHGGAHPQLITESGLRNIKHKLLSGPAIFARKVENVTVMTALIDLLFNESQSQQVITQKVLNQSSVPKKPRDHSLAPIYAFQLGDSYAGGMARFRNDPIQLQPSWF